MTVEYCSAGPFKTDAYNANLIVSFSNTTKLYKPEDTFLMMSHFGSCYLNKDKGNWNAMFVYNCAKLYVYLFLPCNNAAFDSCEIKTEVIPVDLDDQLGIELQTMPTIAATERNLFFNGMKGFKYYSRYKWHKKTTFILIMEGTVELLQKRIWVHFNQT